GKKFWEEVYLKASQAGLSNVPVNTFNKVWIVADQADVDEDGQTAYITHAHLKVMLEEDYLSTQIHRVLARGSSAHSMASSVVRKIILPVLEKEVNEGRNFGPLRQIFYSMILASWYKTALKEALLNRGYGDRSKVLAGINQKDTAENGAIFS